MVAPSLFLFLAGTIIIPHTNKLGAQKISALPVASITKSPQTSDAIKPEMVEYYDLKVTSNSSLSKQ